MVTLIEGIESLELFQVVMIIADKDYFWYLTCTDRYKLRGSKLASST